ncbi:MAG: asparagine synthase (glutamine-hydrolyzing) [Myxococcales bacterium]|nr:asparagine synthase (glutamine-hydrolyzing) [Myxococcales bacterium]
MCGVAGVAHWTDSPLSDAANAAFERLHPRGPDDRGFWAEPWFQAVHTRLSIQDLSWRGHQPFQDGSGRFVTVYNGEIFNFKELNRALAADGVVLHTESDTETLIETFARQQSQAFSSFHGMFAGAIFDRAEQSVYLFRDRLGVKPLFYLETGHGVVFGSTPDVVAQLAGGRPVNRSALPSYLAFRSAPVDGSFFEGVRALKPGTVIKFSAEGQTTETFWDLRDHFGCVDESMTLADGMAGSRELLRRAVKKRLVADVPVGAFLSGGLDSTIVVHYMAEFAKDTIHAHTFSSLNAGTDEVARARRSAEVYGATCHVTDITYQDYFADLRRLTLQKGGPLTVPNEYAIFKMARKMKQHNTVVLSGEASDELFLGYSNVFTAAYNETRSLTKRQIAQWIFDHYRYVRPSALSAVGFGESFLAAYKTEGVAYIFNLISELDSDDLSENLQFFFLRHHLPALLSRLDNATMTASIEGRAPFTDHELVEFALKIPRRLKIGDGKGGTSGKQVLYQAFDDLPQWVTTVPKIGFKLGDTLADSAECRSLLSGAGLGTNGAVDMQQVSVMEKWQLTMLTLFAQMNDCPLQ